MGRPSRTARVSAKSSGAADSAGVNALGSVMNVSVTLSGVGPIMSGGCGSPPMPILSQPPTVKGSASAASRVASTRGRERSVTAQKTT